MTCPNYSDCQLIHKENILKHHDPIKQIYISQFCTSSTEEWQRCKRYKTSQLLNFCPDFVLPNTQLTVDEIIDRFDENNNEN